MKAKESYNKSTTVSSVLTSHFPKKFYIHPNSQLQNRRSHININFWSQVQWVLYSKIYMLEMLLAKILGCGLANNTWWLILLITYAYGMQWNSSCVVCKSMLITLGFVGSSPRVPHECIHTSGSWGDHVMNYHGLTISKSQVIKYVQNMIPRNEKICRCHTCSSYDPKAGQYQCFRRM